MSTLFSNIGKSTFQESKEAFFKSLNEASSVWSPSSDAREDSKNLNHMVNRMTEHIEKYYYDKEGNLTLKVKKEIPVKFNGKISWIDHMLLTVIPNPECNGSEGYVAASSIVYRKTRFGLIRGDINVSLPKTLRRMKATVGPTIKHEFFHLYQFANWHDEDCDKYSISFHDELQKRVGEYKADNDKKICIFDDSVEISDRIAICMMYAFYYLNPIESAAHIQDAYETMKRFHYLYLESGKEVYHNRELDIVNSKLEEPFYYLNTIKYYLENYQVRGLLADEKFVEKVWDEVGEHFEALYHITLNSKDPIKKAYERMKQAYDTLKKKYHKMYALHMQEMSEISENYSKKNLGIVLAIYENHDLKVCANDMEDWQSLNESAYNMLTNIES